MAENVSLAPLNIEIILAKRASSLPPPLLSVLKLIDVTFDRSGHEQKAETCANGILAILSGIAKAKYREAPNIYDDRQFISSHKERKNSRYHSREAHH